MNLKMKNGFSLLEVAIVVILVVILTAAVLPSLNSRILNSVVQTTVQGLASDLRLAQQMALTQKDGYQYYGLQILTASACNSNPAGCYKILRFGTATIPPTLPIGTRTPATVFKGPV